MAKVSFTLMMISCTSIAACGSSRRSLPDGAAIDGLLDTAVPDSTPDGAPDRWLDTAPDSPCPLIVDGSVEGGPSIDAGGREVSENPSRALVQILQGGPWRTSQSAPGLAVNRQGRVFVADEDRIHVVDGSTPSLYLTTGDVGAANTADAFGRAYFDDFDIAPNEQLYILTGNVVMRSTRAREASVWQELPATQRLHPRRMTVVADDDVLVTDRATGMIRVSRCGAQPVYPQAGLWNPGCTTEDLAAQPSGTFLFEGGCNGSALYRGRNDGAGASILYQTEFMKSAPPLDASNFLCLTDSLDGGFYVVIDDAFTRGPRLYHLTEDAAGDHGVTHVPTTPSLRMAQSAQAEPFAFRYCSIAVGPDGTIFLQTRSQLWRISR